MGLNGTRPNTGYCQGLKGTQPSTSVSIPRLILLQFSFQFLTFKAVKTLRQQKLEAWTTPRSNDRSSEEGQGIEGRENVGGRGRIDFCGLNRRSLN